MSRCAADLCRQGREICNRAECGMAESDEADLGQEAVYGWLDALLSILLVALCAGLAAMAWQVWPVIRAALN